MRRTTKVDGRLAQRNTKRHWLRRLFEIALEVVFAVCLVIGISVYAIYGPKNAPFDFKWIPFALNTAYVFGVVLKTARPLWKQTKLWAVLCILLLVHVALGCWVLREVERVPLVWYVPVVVIEIAAVLRVVELSFTAAELEECAPSELQSKAQAVPFGTDQ